LKERIETYRVDKLQVTYSCLHLSNFLQISSGSEDRSARLYRLMSNVMMFPFIRKVGLVGRTGAVPYSYKYNIIGMRPLFILEIELKSCQNVMGAQ
jgi:hypothetical protein